ncbi:putative lipid II flippase FtsW [Lysinibacillus alkalisoli]|uniref:Probable peptidoglycan glycosyltransferase FtsW n=1 Tax=Lysinibacillus alkalisoli TaxID=1911548 RepID=A0A917LGB0_9BACI|nr:FtsW/RodA/SpoVE family cell cycle protein [Lysinibacillus alkalisoli]GGG20793.1 putative lipid II flippase FtsW [Lysinibacillus alkalisoli]
MKRYMKQYLRNFDYGLFITYVVLCLFGLVMIYSASMLVAVMIEDQPPDYFYKKQLTSIIASFFVFVVGAILPYRIYQERKIMGTAILVWIVMYINLWLIGVGAEEVGSRSWVNLFTIIPFQPSEYVKLFVILYFASVLSNKAKKSDNLYLKDIRIPMVIWAGVILCVITEPDYGATTLIIAITISVIMASDLNAKSFWKVFGFVGAGSVALVGVVTFLAPHFFTSNRMSRITSFLDPFKDYLGDGMQVVQGYIAMGSGGLKGVGMGQSVQKLGYLPEPHTDFIIAIISEELGIVGVTIALGGLAFIVLKGFIIAIRSTDSLGRMLATGIASWIGLQTFVNIGGVTGLIPLTGVTLPFFSMGGTSLLVLSFAMGILINVSTLQKMKRNRLVEQNKVDNK